MRQTIPTVAFVLALLCGFPCLAPAQAPAVAARAQGELEAEALIAQVGENISREFWFRRDFDAELFARQAVAGWMASEEHRDNILKSEYDRSGIGVAVNGDHAYVTQIFTGPQKDMPRRASRPQGPQARVDVEF